MWTTDNDHGAQLQFHTGRHMLEGQFPDDRLVGPLRARLAERRPAQFVVLGTPIADCCGGMGGHGASYLGPEHDGVQLAVDPKNPLPFAAPGADVFREEQAREFDLLGRLNRLSAVEYPDDPALRARIKSYELAFRMQTAVPEVLSFADEPALPPTLYGLDHDATRPFGEMCLAARRLVERGVRFVQIFHGSNGGAGAWDAHGGLRQNHAANCAQVDQPIAGLLKDLKQRGLLDETLVVWATEFGRTPGARAATAATIIPTASPSGWPAAASRAASSTAPPTSSASTPSRTATTSPTSTPPSCTSSASTPAASRSPATSGSRSTSASRSPKY